MQSLACVLALFMQLQVFLHQGPVVHRTCLSNFPSSTKCRFSHAPGSNLHPIFAPSAIMDRPNPIKEESPEVQYTHFTFTPLSPRRQEIARKTQHWIHKIAEITRESRIARGITQPGVQGSVVGGQNVHNTCSFIHLCYIQLLMYRFSRPISCPIPPCAELIG